MATAHEQEMLAVLERIAGSLNSIKDDIRYLRNQEAARDAESIRIGEELDRLSGPGRHRSSGLANGIDFDVFTGK